MMDETNNRMVRTTEDAFQEYRETKAGTDTLTEMRQVLTIRIHNRNIAHVHPETSQETKDAMDKHVAAQRAKIAKKEAAGKATKAVRKRKRP